MAAMPTPAINTNDMPACSHKRGPALPAAERPAQERTPPSQRHTHETHIRHVHTKSIIMPCTLSHQVHGAHPKPCSLAQVGVSNMSNHTAPAPRARAPMQMLKPPSAHAHTGVARCRVPKGLDAP